MVRLIRAEWTKLRSVRRWLLGLSSAVLLTLLLSLLAASGSGTDINEYPMFVVGPGGKPVVDEFNFVHQPLSGDGSVAARVVTQQDSHERAGAGVMIKDGIGSGSRYAAVMLTPKHGVRMSANFDTEYAGGAAGSDGSGPRWLKLTRAGDRITGYESGDGASWREIGAVSIAGLPPTLESGLFVSSPPKVSIERQAASTSVGERPTRGRATFDNVTLNDWRADEVIGPRPDLPEGKVGFDDPSEATEDGGVFTVSGTGRIGPFNPDDDLVQVGLFGVIAGLMALAAVGVLFATAEYRRGMIRTTFAAAPRRGRVLAAKAVVLGATAFGIGVIACTAAILLTQPMLRDGGFAPPAFVPVSIMDGPVLRAILTTSGFLAGIAVLGLGLGVILRRSAAAITVTIMLVVVPAIVSATIPVTAALWLLRLTPAGGLATQRAKPPTETLVEPWSMLSPWTGLGVVLVYAVVALLGAWLALRRRDA